MLNLCLYCVHFYDLYSMLLFVIGNYFMFELIVLVFLFMNCIFVVVVCMWDLFHVRLSVDRMLGPTKHVCMCVCARVHAHMHVCACISACMHACMV
jgi:hypothetical protein